jgi:hypothetical protein
MPQLDLSSFVAPKPIKIYDCHNCQNNKGMAGAKVKCMGRLKDIPTGGCSAWSDGNDLSYYHFAPEGFVPKKYRQRG